MRFIKKNWDVLLLILLIVAYSIIFSLLSIQRHNAFASGFDLGNMDQTVWNTLHGRIFALSDGFNGGTTVSRFFIHADLILVLLAPIYLIYDNVRILLVTQSVMLALGALPVFFLAKKILNNKILALCVVLLYLLSPGVEWTNTYDFHGVALAIPFLLAAFYFAYTKKWRLFTLFCVLALTTKEEISLFVVMIGLALFFVFKEKKIGIYTAIVGSVWFITMVFLIMPQFRPDHKHWALSWYRFINPTTAEDQLLPSKEFLSRRLIFSPRTQEYYAMLLKQMAFLPLTGFPWLLLALPELLINVLSSHGQMRSIVFHYDSGITPALFIATIFGLKYIHLLLGKIKLIMKYNTHAMNVVGIIAVFIALRVNYHFSPLPTTEACWCLSYRVTQEDRDFEAALQKIPSQASVTASPEIHPHLTHRENSFTLPTATASAQYIALITQNRLVGNYDAKDYELRLIEDLKKNKNHQLIFKSEHFYLFKRR